MNILEIADAVRTVLAFPVDYIAHQNRGAYEIVFDVCMNTQTGQVSAIPIFELMFEVQTLVYVLMHKPIIKSNNTLGASE